MVCDLCNKTLSSYEGTRVPLAEMQGAARRGFNPYTSAGIAPDLSNPMTLMAVAMGGSKEQMYEQWKQRLTQDTTDWMLCSKCHAAFRLF
jgi:hypothetical protein